jgi:hypothetical protein
VNEALENDGPAISASIATLRGLDLSALPERMAKQLLGSADNAEAAQTALSDAFAAEQAVDDAAGPYRPMLRNVRRLEKDIRKIDETVAELKQRAGRLRDASDADLKERLLERAARLEEERAGIKAQVPESWTATHKTFADLTKAEDRARLTYRRSADNAYEPVREVLDLVEATDAFVAVGDDLRALRAAIETGPLEEAEAAAGDIYARLGDIAGGDDVRSALTKARRAMKASPPDRQGALAEYDDALAIFTAEAEWRQKAAASIGAGLAQYEAAIRDTFGARLQTRLSREQALYIAACGAGHRDLSLNF